MHTINLHWHSVLGGIVVGATIVGIAWGVDSYLTSIGYKAQLRKETLALIEKNLKENGCIRKKISSYTISQVQHGVAVATKCAQ